MERIKREPIERIREYVRKWGNFPPGDQSPIGEMLEDVGRRGMPMPRFDPWMGYALDDLSLSAPAENAKWTAFFKQAEDYRIETRFYENGFSFTCEELYQAFKARLVDELKFTAPPTQE